MTLLKVVVHFPCGWFHRSSFIVSFCIFQFAFCFLLFYIVSHFINKSIKIHVHSDCLQYFHSNILYFIQMCALYALREPCTLIITVKRQPNLFSVSAKSKKWSSNRIGEQKSKIKSDEKASVERWNCSCNIFSRWTQSLKQQFCMYVCSVRWIVCSV